MVQTLGTNSNNDIFQGPDGNIVMLSAIDAVAAACATAAKAQLGEMALAKNNGIPNFQTVWIGTPNYAIFAAYLRKTLESVEGVIEVKDISFSAKNNILSYRATIKTIFSRIGPPPLGGSPVPNEIILWGQEGVTWGGDFTWGPL